MPITSISRDTNNNVCLVRMISTDTLATVTSTDYILDQNDNITALNGGTWEWFFSDMILCKCSDQVALLVFRGSNFNTVSSYAEQGSGTVNPGLQNQLAYYATNGSAISGLATANNGVLVTSNVGVPSIASTLPFAVQDNITRLGTITSGVWQGTDITVPFGGTGNTTFTAYSVICAGTSSTSAFQNVTGVGTSGQVLTSNGAAALPTWQAPAGTGTVSPGLQNQIAYYAADGTTVSGLTGGTNGVLITSGLGVPSISSTLPITVQTNITELGTITVGTWHGSVIGATYGGTGVNNGSSTITIGGNVTFSGAFTFTGTLTGNTSVTFPTSGTLATTSQVILWNDVSGTSQTASGNNGYIISNASQTTVSIPASIAEGQIIGVAGKGAGGWILQANIGQTIHFGNLATSSGGALTSSNLYDNVIILCITANTTFVVLSAVGNITVS